MLADFGTFGTAAAFSFVRDGAAPLRPMKSADQISLGCAKITNRVFTRAAAAAPASLDVELAHEPRRLHAGLGLLRLGDDPLFTESDFFTEFSCRKPPLPNGPRRQAADTVAAPSSSTRRSPHSFAGLLAKVGGTINCGRRAAMPDSPAWANIERNSGLSELRTWRSFRSVASCALH